MIDWDTFKAQLETNPGRVLKSVLLLAGSFLLIWLLVVWQSESPQTQRVQVQASGRLDSLQLRAGVKSAGRDTPSQPTIPSRTESTTMSQTDSNMFGIFPKVVFAFIALGGVWLWLRSKKSSTSGPSNKKIFTTIGTQQLPGGQRLTVTRINGEYWVMATNGSQGVSLLHRYSEEEWQGVTEEPAAKDWKQTFMTTLKSTASEAKQTG